MLGDRSDPSSTSPLAELSFSEQLDEQRFCERFIDGELPHRYGVALGVRGRILIVVKYLGEVQGSQASLALPLLNKWL